MEENTIVYQLDQSVRTETALHNAANEVLAKLNTKFGSEYTVKANDFGVKEKDWSHEIKVRKGNKIGAEVSFKWEQADAKIVKLDVSDSSKLGSQITFITLIVFVGIGAYMGYNDIEPLAFLPGYKIAAGLGGLIGMIPGLILVGVLKSLFLKKEKEINKKLVQEVRDLIK